MAGEGRKISVKQSGDTVPGHRLVDFKAKGKHYDCLV